MDSKVLILDEPFSALDSNSENYLMETLNSIKKDRIIIVITHNQNLIKKFDKVLKINHDQKNIELIDND